jgi:hypothetical protein
MEEEQVIDVVDDIDVIYGASQDLHGQIEPWYTDSSGQQIEWSTPTQSRNQTTKSYHALRFQSSRTDAVYPLSQLSQDHHH